MEKRHELSLILKFTQVSAETSHLNCGILTKEWAKGNRISAVQRTDSGTNADGGYKTDRGEGAHHTLDSLDLEIACALLPMDFNPHEIPGSVLRRAKEIVAKKRNRGNRGATSCVINRGAGSEPHSNLQSRAYRS